MAAWLILILFNCHTSDHHFLLAMQVPWRTRFKGGGGRGVEGQGRGPYHSPAFSDSTLPCWYPGNSLLGHSPKYVRMSTLSESRRGPCISYLDFLINTDRSLFPQEDIRNDLHVIWFEAKTRGILVEEVFRLNTSYRFFLIVRNTPYHNYTYFAQSSLYIILDYSTSCHC